MKPKTIYCPQCGHKTGKYDGKSTIDCITRCRNCRKRVIYHIDTGETEIKPLPLRASSSGVLFV